jgi:hypothetical protein
MQPAIAFCRSAIRRFEKMRFARLISIGGIPGSRDTIGSIRGTSSPGRCGRARPTRKRTSDGPANVGKLWRPFLVAGSYGNYVADEGEAIAREAYGPNYDRLVALKNKYDPTNFFRMNHNISQTAWA